MRSNTRTAATGEATQDESNVQKQKRRKLSARKKWTEEDEQIIINTITREKPKLDDGRLTYARLWSSLESQLPERSARAIEERWKNILKKRVGSRVNGGHTVELSSSTKSVGNGETSIRCTKAVGNLSETTGVKDSSATASTIHGSNMIILPRYQAKRARHAPDTLVQYHCDKQGRPIQCIVVRVALLPTQGTFLYDLVGKEDESRHGFVHECRVFDCPLNPMPDDTSLKVVASKHWRACSIPPCKANGCVEKAQKGYEHERLCRWHRTEGKRKSIGNDLSEDSDGDWV